MCNKVAKLQSGRLHEVAQQCVVASDYFLPFGWNRLRSRYLLMKGSRPSLAMLALSDSWQCMPSLPLSFLGWLGDQLRTNEDGCNEALCTLRHVLHVQTLDPKKAVLGLFSRHLGVDAWCQDARERNIVTGISNWMTAHCGKLKNPPLSC